MHADANCLGFDEGCGLESKKHADNLKMMYLVLRQAPLRVHKEGPRDDFCFVQP